MFEIGNSLREARIRKGLNLKDAEDATKIRSKYLQALEDDDFEVIPGPAYVKGFLRTYADFLGLDAELLLDEYRSRHEPNQEVHYVARRPVGRARSRGPRRQSNLVIVVVVALVLVAALAWMGWGRGEQVATVEPETVDTSSTTTSTLIEETVTTTAAGETTEQTEAQATTTTLAEGKLAVVVKAVRARCWLLAKEGSGEGKVLYSGTLEKGKAVRLESAEQYWLNIGSPSSLEVTVNGADVAVPEPYGNYLLSASGLERLP